MVAGRAVGKWDIERIEIPISQSTFYPTVTDDERDVRYTKWKMAIDRSLGWDTSMQQKRGVTSP